MVCHAPTSNEEAIEAWNGVLFERFVQYRHIVVAGLSPHGDEALRRHPPARGSRVVDIGCGFGDSACQIAGMVGSQGGVLGVDAAERFIESARTEARQAGVPNVRFEVMDVETEDFEETFDYAFARFGTMFFASPVAALRRVRAALEPGGRLCIVVWRRKLDNPWLHRAEQVVERFVEEPEDSDEPVCGPGPFSMANADTVGEILLGAGFERIGFERLDLPYRMGRDMAEAIALITALGPAGELIRLAGEEADQLRPQIEEALAEDLAEFAQPDGSLVGNSSTWIVTARNPA